MIELVNPLMVAFDLDNAQQAMDLAKKLDGKIGAIKVGPRLCVRYGASLIEALSSYAPVFVDNKYLDIPNTMEAAIRATFDAQATFATVHAWAGKEALERLAKVEAELNEINPFKILTVTVLTSFAEGGLAPGMTKEPLGTHVDGLAKLAIDSGLTGIVCSPQEVQRLRMQHKNSFLVTPGVRLATDDVGDQKRVETPEAAIRLGASALVVGRPIVDAKDPVLAAEKILESALSGKI